MLNLCVIICTYNPRKDYILQVLHSLRSQSLDESKWELLIVDNASSNKVLNSCAKFFPVNTRVVVELQQGLTHARMRGIRETNSDIVVFADDDNVLDSDYLQNVLEIHEKHPYIGVWGGGVNGSYETLPTKTILKFEELLANRPCKTTKWACAYYSDFTPFGAGICVLRLVLDTYLQSIENNPSKSRLDRKGALLTGGGDVDIAYTAVDMGLAIGRFHALQLKHLIPNQRISCRYLARLAYGSSFSHLLLLSYREQTWSNCIKPSFSKLAINIAKNLFHGPSALYIVFSAWRGERKGWKCAVR